MLDRKGILCSSPPSGSTTCAARSRVTLWTPVITRTSSVAWAAGKRWAVMNRYNIVDTKRMAAALGRLEDARKATSATATVAPFEQAAEARPRKNTENDEGVSGIAPTNPRPSSLFAEFRVTTHFASRSAR